MNNPAARMTFSPVRSRADWLIRWAGAAALACGLGALAVAPAQAQVQIRIQSGVVAAPGASASAANPAGEMSERELAAWLARLREASRGRSFQGVFVVSSTAGALSSSRIWHVCDGQQQMERVDALTGVPRTTLRRDDQVLTFFPTVKLARSERLESPGLFPELLRPGNNAIASYYSARRIGGDRVAGLEADGVELMPRDLMRFGYRIWSEHQTGLVVKLQTLDAATGQVLEQAAFSELLLDAPVSMDKLAQMMNATAGYRVETPALVRTTAESQGWAIASPVPGYRPMNCYLRGSEAVLQCIFSDGLASVSVFVEPWDAKRHAQEGVRRLGATQTLTRRLVDRSGAAWWITTVGEAPLRTLAAFSQAPERRP